MKRVIFVSIGLVLLLGCGSRRGSGGSVTGKITYKGQPVNHAMLFFHPASGEGNDFDVSTTQEGTFDAANIPPGEYKIYVESARVPKDATKEPPVPQGMDPAKAAEMKAKFAKMRGSAAPTIAFPNKYKKAETSDLKCTIKEGGRQQINLEMKD